ncbi:hypothetical protein THAOC_18483, partial [Thalassiosira oceanica]
VLRRRADPPGPLGLPRPQRPGQVQGPGGLPRVLLGTKGRADPDRLRGRQPRELQLPPGAPLRRVGRAEHLLPRRGGAVRLCKRTEGPGGNTSVSSLRVAGLSGIYNGRHYRLGRYEMPPYGRDELRSVYHTREVDVARMKALGDGPTDVMISHDWPRGVHRHGDEADLVRRKPFFGEEVWSNTLGSVANGELLGTLRPGHWFAAHLHVKFEAEVCHAAPQGGRERRRRRGEGRRRRRRGRRLPGPDDPASLSPRQVPAPRRHIQVVHVEPSSSRPVGHPA